MIGMLPEGLVRKRSFSRNTVYKLAVIVALSVSAVFSLVPIQRVHAQATSPASAPNPAQDITGTWQGTLHAGQDLRIVVKISKADAGGYKVDFYSIDQGGQPIPVDKTTLDGTTVKMAVKLIGGTYEGKLSADGKSIVGNWTQGPNPLALNFARATPETEWSIPTPPPPIPPMAADANPSFDVATIKPSKPDDQRKAFIVRGNEFHIINEPLTQIMSTC
jgi:hypothetical protein